MSRVVSNVRPPALVRWSRPAALWAAVLAPLALIALPARALWDEEERLRRITAHVHERSAEDPAKDLAPEAARALLGRAQGLRARVEALRPIELGPFEARTLLLVTAREQGLELDDLAFTGTDEPATARWTASGRGRLAQWTGWIDRLATLRLSACVESARFESAPEGGFRARLELVLARRSPPVASTAAASTGAATAPVAPPAEAAR